MITPADRALLQLVKQHDEITITELLGLDAITAILDADPTMSLRSRMVSLRADGYLAGFKHTNTTRTVYSISDSGERALRMVPATLGDIATPRRPHSRATYDGAELRPFSARPGAMDAFSKPSVEGGKVIERRRPSLTATGA